MSNPKFDPPVKHLLVDLDGTLVGARAFPLALDFIRGSMRAVRSHGPWHKGASALLAVGREFGRPSRETANDIRIVELFARRMGMTIEEGRQVLRDGLFKFFPGLERHFYPIEGAKDFLDWAKDLFPLALATNPVWPPEIVELRVRWAGIDPAIFSFVSHIREMKGCKPSLEYYEGLLEKLKVPAEDCLLIGNDVKMDLPATRAGIRVFIVGPYKEVTRLKHAGNSVPAWRGSYFDLRRMLEGPPSAG